MSSRDTNRVKLERDPLVEAQLLRSWRSSGSSLPVEMVQDATDDGGVGNEGKDLHFLPTPRAGQRVDFVDPVDELGPSSAENAS